MAAKKKPTPAKKTAAPKGPALTPSRDSKTAGAPPAGTMRSVREAAADRPNAPTHNDAGEALVTVTALRAGVLVPTPNGRSKFEIGSDHKGVLVTKTWATANADKVRIKL